MKPELIRTCRFYPYGRSRRKGKYIGAWFTLRLFDTHRTDSDGKSILSYELIEHCDGDTWPIFKGEDFHCSPLHAIDSDETVSAVMSFLTCKPGDTDPKYFAHYGGVQLEFCDQYAEALSVEVMRRFGEC